MPVNSRVSRRLDQAGNWTFSAWCIVAAFSTYFCMYAFRKPFTAGTFEGEMLAGINYKTVLVVAQVFGYTLSKFIGIKVISEMEASRRAIGVLVLIGLAHVCLLLFGCTPPPYNFVFLFLNGLPLGMVFGLVLSFLEGRRVTEALTAGLCASFIMSSGVVKSVGRSLVEYGGVSEYWMPFWTGMIFLPPLLLSVWMLAQIPPPDKEDVACRAERKPMSRADRKAFFSAHWLGLCLIVATYSLLTVMRSIRDDFGVEIWQELGQVGNPQVYAISETLVMLAVVAVNGAAIMIHDNRRALRTALMTILIGFVVVVAAIGGLKQGWLSGFSFMIVAGVGMYVPYVAFHTTLFERMIAVFRGTSNIGYLMYLADAVGYLGYVAVMLLRNVEQPSRKYLDFFIFSTAGICLVSVVLMSVCLWHFHRKMEDHSRLSEGGGQPMGLPHGAIGGSADN
jgi:hypothetical protein